MERRQSLKGLFLIALLLCGIAARADYGYMSLPNVVCEADYGAIGTIVALDRSYFYLKVEEYVLGDLELDTLRIQKFENWSCGKRYGKYEVGQRELVFFVKSNYVIEDFELLGIGGGGEFELPIRKDSIYYHCSYDGLKPFGLETFTNTVRDFDQVKEHVRKSSKALSVQERDQFTTRSDLHKRFMDCKPGINTSRVPVASKKKSPQPSIYFDSFYRDTISRWNDAIPRAAYFLGPQQVDRNLEYDLLSYTYEIHTADRVESYKIKSARGTLELHDRLRKLKSGDRISVKDMLVLYPDGTVRKLPERTVYVKK